MNYFCCEEQRRIALKGHPALNGIDFLEVVDNTEDTFEERQTTLIIHFINPLSPGSMQIENIVIEGGERITNIQVIAISFGLDSPPSSPVSSPPGDDSTRILIVKVKEAGDFSTYTLRLIQDSEHTDPPAGFDPILSAVEFSFKVLCPTDFDCQPKHICVTEIENSPEISYLAKDYSSFRQLMLDRMALLVPQWKERNPADLGILLVELLAYAGDYLSYRQDAIATEAYLGTARKRSSVRRHARLVDYFMHDGCNARTWAHIEVKEGIRDLLLKTKADADGEKTKILTKGTGLPVIFRADDKEFETALLQQLKIFELLHDITLDERHNEMHFYTWLQGECCLPKGAAAATLDGHLPALKKGDVLIFAEIAGPVTGEPGDADPLHRHAVQLTDVVLSEDPIGNPQQSPLDYTPRPVTKIKWHDEDALPFPLCISSTSEDRETIIVSVAYGNNVLVDHGFTISEILPAVPETNNGSATGLKIIQLSSDSCACEKPVSTAIPVRYRPSLKNIPVTQVAPYDQIAPPVSANSCTVWSMRDPLPAVFLEQTGAEGNWMPQRDLLNSKHNDEHFVVEIESDGTASLRFGNDIEGQRPEPGTEFTAHYRIGNGVIGNIGSNTLYHIVSNAPEITADKISKICNPLPATGGTEQESMQVARMRAPIAFRRQERAVTMADYEEVSKRCSTEIQRSAASLRWTGSWRTVFLTVDRTGGKKIDEKFEEQLRSCLEKYRMAGQDLEVDGPKFVSLEIEMTVCVNANYFRSDVKAALLDLFSNRTLPDGKPGVFHPDNFSFGQPVYLSPLYAAAQQTEGVESVRVTKFQRQGTDDIKAMEDGKLLLNRLEIARLDNDSNFPEHGIFKLTMQGGK
jgi:hypothetical protein